jgi:inosine-uridine nucleoside N-ribohydrolase
MGVCDFQGIGEMRTIFGGKTAFLEPDWAKNITRIVIFGGCFALGVEGPAAEQDAETAPRSYRSCEEHDAGAKARITLLALSARLNSLLKKSEQKANPASGEVSRG